MSENLINWAGGVFVAAWVLVVVVELALHIKREEKDSNDVE